MVEISPLSSSDKISVDLKIKDSKKIIPREPKSNSDYTDISL